MSVKIGLAHRLTRVLKLITILGFSLNLVVFLLPKTAHAALPTIDTMTDHIPDFCSSPTKTSAASGNWSSPATWSPAGVPAANDIVVIAAGHTVAFDAASTPSLNCVGVKGTLNFRTDISTSLKAGTVLVYEIGHFFVGTATSPIGPNVSAEIIIANKPIDLLNDPDQFGTGLLAFGEIKMTGATKNPTFIRLAAEPMAGQTSLTLSAAATGWKIGDRVFVPDTRHLTGGETESFTGQWEERTIQTISGTTLTLNQALTYNHKGARDGNGILNFLPHVGNLTRNVIIRSENPSGTRGHTMMTHKADADIRYVAFKDLGRTTYSPLDPAINHIGRYPLHMHHLMGPLTATSNGYQFTLIGNAVDGGTANNPHKWAITLHDSHWGLVSDNVMYNFGGSGFMTETGNESFNVIDHNFAVRGIGNGQRDGAGSEATGFWLRGPNNYVRNNVASNFPGRAGDDNFGYKIWQQFLDNVNIPNFKGADTAVAGQFTVKPGNAMPLLEFNNNEAYGATVGGFTDWWLGSYGDTPLSTSDSIIKDLKIWNVFNYAVFHYPSSRVIFDGLIVRGSQPAGVAACCGLGWYGADYLASDITIRNADIQGMRSGISPSTNSRGTQLIENSYLRNYSNINVSTLFTSGYASDGMTPRKIVVNNVKFDSMPGAASVNIKTGFGADCSCNVIQKDQIIVTKYNQVAGQNFDVYYKEQAPSFIVPPSLYAYDSRMVRTGSPEADLTNQQNWNKYGVAIAGAPAPCTDSTTHPEIIGFVCTAAVAPANPSLPYISVFGGSNYGFFNLGQSSILSWAVSGASSVSIDQGIGAVALTGTRSVSPTQTTKYTLTATNSNGSVTRSVSLGVNESSGPPLITSFTANPSTVAAGKFASVSWSTRNAMIVRLDTSLANLFNVSNVQAAGSQFYAPGTSGVFTLTATSSSGAVVTQNLTVTVGGTPPPPTPTPPPPSPTPSPTPTPVPTPMPGPWLSQDIGSVGLVGSSSLANGVFTVKGSGNDILDTADAFRYVYQPMTGDGQIVARVLSVQNTDPWAKAGVMMRQDLTQGSKNTTLIVSPINGLSFQRRAVTGGLSTFNVSPGSPPYWVKLVRTGATLGAYASPNGSTWTQIGTDTITFPGTIFVGLAVTSHNNSLSSTATFDSITVSSGPAVPPPVDTTVPAVISFDVQPRTATGSITASFTATDAGGSFLNMAQLFKANFNSTNCSVSIKTGCIWSSVQTVNAPVSSNTWTGGMLNSPIVGNYWFRLQVVDNAGNIGVVSNPIQVVINALPTPLPNSPPTVSLVSPTAGFLYVAPSIVTLKATAADSDGIVNRVDYFIGASLTPIASSTAGPSYTATWNNVPIGIYSVTARATDDLGAMTTSAPIIVTITPALPTTVSTIYLASVDFHAVGGHNWSYRESGNRSMNFISSIDSWRGSEQNSLLWNNGGHPGNNRDVIRRFTVPSTGTVRITGNAARSDLSCGGDGVLVSIMKNSTTLWQQVISNAASYAYDLTSNVNRNDRLDFVINKRGNNTCDSTTFDPNIVLTVPGAPTP